MSVARLLLPAAALLGEGPVWDAASATLWWVDIKGRRLHAWRHGPAQAESWGLPLMPSLAVPMGDGRLLMVTDEGLVPFDPATAVLAGAAQPLEPGRPGNRSNDSKVGPGGWLLCGTMGRAAETGAGALYAVAEEGRKHRLLDGLTIPNGLAFSPDGRFVHLADSAQRTVWRAGWDAATGQIGPLKPFLQHCGPGAPDGAAIAADGSYWVALWGEGRVIGVAPDGAQMGEVRVPVRQVSACAFGGPDLRTLFITSAAEGDDSPDAGGLFAAEMEVAGSPVPGFSWRGERPDGGRDRD